MQSWPTDSGTGGSAPRPHQPEAQAKEWPSLAPQDYSERGPGSNPGNTRPRRAMPQDVGGKRVTVPTGRPECYPATQRIEPGRAGPRWACPESVSQLATCTVGQLTGENLASHLANRW